METSEDQEETTPKSSDAAPHSLNLSDDRAAAHSRENGLVPWRTDPVAFTTRTLTSLD